MITRIIKLKYISADEVIRGFNAMINQPPQVLDAMAKYLKAGGD